MFGFLQSRMNCLSTEDWNSLSTINCGMCHVFRKEYGIWSSLLAGWEGRFLALLIDSQNAEQFNFSETRCPVTLWLCRRQISEKDTALQYATAVVMRLFEEKLVDNIRDEDSIHTKWVHHWLNSRFKQANLTLKKLDFPVEKFNAFLSRQFAIESFTQVHVLDDATAPFACAMGLLTAHTCRIAGAHDNFNSLDKIGRLIGRVITIIDACHDYSRDYVKNRYNVIRETSLCISPGNSLSVSQIGRVENYLLSNLKAIRSYTNKLVLYRNAGAVHNIMQLGLFDASMRAIQQVSKEKAYMPIRRFRPISCTSCGHSMDSRFCPHCGKIRSITL